MSTGRAKFSSLPPSASGWYATQKGSRIHCPSQVKLDLLDDLENRSSRALVDVAMAASEVPVVYLETRLDKKSSGLHILQ